MNKNIALLFGLILFSVPCLLQAQTAEERIADSILGSWYGENSPSVGVLIIQQGEVKLMKTYGYANREEKVKADVHTNYDLATLSGQFTVMAAMMLQEEGKIDPKEKIIDIWPQLPGYCKGITVGHLFNQNSGLPLLNRQKVYADIHSFEDLLAFLKESKPLAQPGKRSQRNPLSNVLLARLIEERSGMSYRKFVQKRIFEPLGMEQSRVYKKGWFTGVPGKAKSYYRGDDNTYEPAGAFPSPYLQGPIGVFSNLEDLQKWFMAWEKDTLVSDGLLRSAQRINFIRGQKNFPGYGWTRAFNKGDKYLYQPGVGRGNSHIFLKVPPAGITVAILSNQMPLFDLRKRAFELVNIYSDKKYEPQ